VALAAAAAASNVGVKKVEVVEQEVAIFLTESCKYPTEKVFL